MPLGKMPLNSEQRQIFERQLFKSAWAFLLLNKLFAVISVLISKELYPFKHKLFFYDSICSRLKIIRPGVGTPKEVHVFEQ